MKRSKTYTAIHWTEEAAKNHKKAIEKGGGKVTLWRKLYDESKGHYYELTYKY